MPTFPLNKQNEKGVNVLKVDKLSLLLRCHLVKGVVNSKMSSFIHSSCRYTPVWPQKTKMFWKNVPTIFNNKSGPKQHQTKFNFIVWKEYCFICLFKKKKSTYWQYKTYWLATSWKHTGNYPGYFKSGWNEALYRSYCELFIRMYDLFLKRLFDLIILNQTVITQLVKNDSLLWWHMLDFSSNLVHLNPIPPQLTKLAFIFWFLKTQSTTYV